MRLHIIALAFLLPLCAGCAANVEKKDILTPLLEAQKSLKPTVANYDTMTFTPTIYPSTIDVKISVGDPTFDFGTDGVSYFKAIELPKTDTPYLLDISSAAIAYDCYPCHRGNFLAEIKFLDAEKKPVEETDRQRFWSITDDRYCRHITASIRPSMKARYAVIYTTRAALKEGEWGSLNTGPGVAPVGLLFIPVPAPRVGTNGMPVGDMTVTFGPPPEES